MNENLYNKESQQENTQDNLSLFTSSQTPPEHTHSDIHLVPFLQEVWNKVPIQFKIGTITSLTLLIILPILLFASYQRARTQSKASSQIPATHPIGGASLALDATLPSSTPVPTLTPYPTNPQAPTPTDTDPQNTPSSLSTPTPQISNTPISTPSPFPTLKDPLLPTQTNQPAQPTNSSTQKQDTALSTLSRILAFVLFVFVALAFLYKKYRMILIRTLHHRLSNTSTEKSPWGTPMGKASQETHTANQPTQTTTENEHPTT